VGRFDDAGVERVDDVAGEDVQARGDVALFVGGAEVDQRVDGVEPGVLGQGRGTSSSASAKDSTASCSRPSTLSA